MGAQFQSICGLYYLQIMIVYDESSIVEKWHELFTDDTIVTIYNWNMFIIQATGEP